MDAPKKRFNRLVGALEELVTHEAATIAAHNFEAVGDIQRRTQPLVEAIASMGPEIADSVARARVASLLAQRQHSIDFLESQLETARSEMMAVQESTRRAARIAPVYGRPAVSSHESQFRARG